MKHPGGRPVLFANSEEGLKQFISKIETCDKKNVNRLAKHLGVTRQTLYRYMERGENWTKVIKG